MKIIASCFILILIHYVCKCAAQKNDTCIRSGAELENSFSKNENNAFEVWKGFCPVDKAPSDVVWVRYCVHNSTDVDTAACNESFANFTFQWLDTVLALAVNTEVFKALTFNFAELNFGTANLAIGSFCEDLEDEEVLNLLYIFTSKLKLNPNICTEEKKRREGYALRFQKENGKLYAKNKEEKLKFIIAAWLFSSTLTITGIIQCGRYEKARKKLENVTKDFTSLFSTIMNILTIFGILSKLIKILKELSDDKKVTKKDEKGSKENESEKAKGSENIQTSSSSDEDVKSKTPEDASINSNCDRTDTCTSAPKLNMDLFPFINAKQAESLYSICVACFLLMIILDLILLANWKLNNKTVPLSIEWIFCYPIVVWLPLLLIINLIFYSIKLILKCKCQDSTYCLLWRHSKYSLCKVIHEELCNFIVVISVTTLPLFICFHGFWLFIAAVAFPARVAASAAFYAPVLFAIILYIHPIMKSCCWLYNQFSNLKCRRKSPEYYEELAEYDGVDFKSPSCDKKSLKIFVIFPILFLPFWITFLLSLYYISDFILRLVNTTEDSWTIIFVALGTIGFAHKLAVKCSSFSQELKDEQEQEK